MAARRVMNKLDVSIHATLAGGDSSTATLWTAIAVSIHATLAGGDHLALD